MGFTGKGPFATTVAFPPQCVVGRAACTKVTRNEGFRPATRTGITTVRGRSPVRATRDEVEAPMRDAETAHREGKKDLRAA